MEDPGLIFEEKGKADVAGVHAIVIGIGHYRHLPGGLADETQLPEVPPIAQLTAPPHSARAMANFFFDTYHGDPAHPLSSLSVLIAEKDPKPYKHLLVPDRNIADATIANLRAAVRAWKQRGDRNEDNLLIFYICCHGISSGIQHTLIASDFAKDGEKLFTRAIDLTELHRGMGQCKAKAQVYFIDACRVMTPKLLEEEYKGDPIVEADGSVAPRSSPIFKSSLSGDATWSLRDQPSPFAQSIGKAYLGGAWRREQGRWLVCSTLLKTAMQHQIKRILWQFPRFPSDIDRDNDVTLILKYPKDGQEPLVPLDVLCAPGDANLTVRLELLRTGAAAPLKIPSRDPALPAAWLLDVPRGEYKVSCSFDEQNFEDRVLEGIMVYPPNASERVEVT
jgi:Caspase domain